MADMKSQTNLLPEAGGLCLGACPCPGRMCPVSPQVTILEATKSSNKQAHGSRHVVEVPFARAHVKAARRTSKPEGAML